MIERISSHMNVCGFWYHLQHHLLFHVVSRARASAAKSRCQRILQRFLLFRLHNIHLGIIQIPVYFELLIMAPSRCNANFLSYCPISLPLLLL